MKVIHTIAGGKDGGAEMAYVDTVIAQTEAGMDVIAACRPNDVPDDVLFPSRYEPFGTTFGQAEAAKTL